jgi:hypothetical protein
MGGDVVTIPKFENGQPLMLACWVVGAWITWDINSYAIVQWPKMTRVLTSSEEENFSLRRRPTWMKCLFVPPLNLCPLDKGVEVKNYFPLSRVDTVVTSNQ